MYIPTAFRETRREVLHGLIRQYSFGTLVSYGRGGLEATHLPFLLDPDRGPHGALLGHLARANEQWRGFADNAEASPAEVLAIFQGPHAYVSPSWYEEHPSVPTWNYAVVHAYGVPRLIKEPEDLERLLRALVKQHEPEDGSGWTWDLPVDYVAQMMQGIVGFEIPITRLEGKLKLSQNRPLADRPGIVQGLIEQGDELSMAVARLMERDLHA